MRPDTDATTAGRAEGAEYARAALHGIGAGTASPEHLASLMQFLHSGDLLHGFAVVLHEALRHALAKAANREPA